MTYPITIRDAQPQDRDATARVLTDALACCPAVTWAEPDPHERQPLLQPYVTALLQNSCHVRVAQLGGRIVAAAIHTSRPGDGPDLRELAAVVRLTAAAQRLTQLDQAACRQRPTGRYQHLACLAVSPHHQNRGIGGRLMRDHETCVSATGLPVYLEAGSPRSRALCLRHGFTDYRSPVTAAGSPPLYPMWRPARSCP
ncbi:GNAT family N-acetyltransferase [Actinoplanes sp. Pm04-4]|uniref:GNAT family N-acetyltransferase n=1 Tax=Paractinoplanes pyxinae TaxID=2997416 RepID=A0ABT4BC15_9ACTN|nr:GNAT family N-acetyltransferase [Actinoplanes pyxinae]MCY1144056.1 GNAT family N-acetyltransferase [Actinoplanes pyxinae]